MCLYYQAQLEGELEEARARVASAAAAERAGGVKNAALNEELERTQVSAKWS